MPNRPHIIRLREPWAREVINDPNGAERLQWRRSFGRPTRLTPSCRVMLSVDLPEQPGQVTLNDHLFRASPSEGGPFRYDITALLRDRNQLVIQLISTRQIESVTGVQLEIFEDEDKS